MVEFSVGYNRDGGGGGPIDGRDNYRECVCEIESKKIDSEIIYSEIMD